MHDYWNYAALVPVAIAIAAGADRVIASARPERRSFTRVLVCVASSCCLALALAVPSTAENILENGVGTVQLARTATERTPGSGPHIAYVSSGGSLSRWIDYETGAPGLPLDGVEALRSLAAERPDFPVLVVVPLLPPARQQFVIANAIETAGPYVLATARVAATAHD
jgi:hypothetical protein